MKRLSNLAQKAIIAHRVIHSIRNWPFITNEQLIAMPQHQFQELNKNIRPMGENLLLKPLATEAAFEKHNYESVANIFKYGHGLPLSAFPSKNDNFTAKLKGASNVYLPNPSIRSLVFFPTSTTSRLFNYIFQQKGKGFIYGDSGIGKTFSSLLLWHLSSMIAEFRVKQKQDESTVAEFANWKQFSKTPKIIYLNFQRNFNQSELAKDICSQCPELDFNKLAEKEKDSIKAITKFIFEQYLVRGLQVKLIIDCQQLSKKYQQKQKQKMPEKQSKVILSESVNSFEQLKDLLGVYFNYSILTNSTNQFVTDKQNFGIRKYTRLQKPQQNPYSQIEGLKFLHYSRHNQEYEQVETTLMIWFQVIRKLINQRMKLTDERINNLYLGFQPYNKYAKSWGTQNQVCWTNHTHSRFLKFQSIGLTYRIQDEWAKLYMNKEIDYSNYYDMKEIISSFSKEEDQVIGKQNYLNFQTQVILRIIYKESCRQLQSNDSFAFFSNRFRLHKEKLPPGMFQSRDFYGLSCILAHNGQFYVLRNPRVMKEMIIKTFQRRKLSL